MKRRVIYVSEEEWSVWMREAATTEPRCTVSEFIRSHLMGYVRAARDGDPVVLVDVPVVHGAATLPDGRTVESSAQVVRVPILSERYDVRPIRPVPKNRK